MYLPLGRAFGLRNDKRQAKPEAEWKFGERKGQLRPFIFSPFPQFSPPTFSCDPPQNSDAKGEGALTSYDLPLRKTVYMLAEITKA